jgi:hypothetical protein
VQGKLTIQYLKAQWRSPSCVLVHPLECKFLAPKNIDSYLFGCFRVAVTGISGILPSWGWKMKFGRTLITMRVHADQTDFYLSECVHWLLSHEKTSRTKSNWSNELHYNPLGVLLGLLPASLSDDIMKATPCHQSMIPPVKNNMVSNHSEYGLFSFSSLY